MSQLGTGIVLIGNIVGLAGFAVAQCGTGLVLIGLERIGLDTLHLL